MQYNYKFVIAIISIHPILFYAVIREYPFLGLQFPPSPKPHISWQAADSNVHTITTTEDIKTDTFKFSQIIDVTDEGNSGKHSKGESMQIKVSRRLIIVHKTNWSKAILTLKMF